MVNIDDYMFISNILKLDLHGYDRQTARVAINDFINDAMKQNIDIIEIVHGIGSGIIRKVTTETLKKNKNVIDFKSSYFNQGSTIVKIKCK